MEDSFEIELSGKPGFLAGDLVLLGQPIRIAFLGPGSATTLVMCDIYGDGKEPTAKTASGLVGSTPTR